jgi:hypothetical protein
VLLVQILKWEPIPWDAGFFTTIEQWNGFRVRSKKKIVWTKVDFRLGNELNVFGFDSDFLISNDVSYFSSKNDENYLLVENTWFGWPDPPKYGLISSINNTNKSKWKYWGHFDELPSNWAVP